MKLKRTLALALALALCLCLSAGCAKRQTTLKVGASPTPHGEILKFIQPQLEKKGIKLEIVEFSDYVLPNTSLQDGQLDANYFQHITYLNNFNDENGTTLVSAASVHYEPMGIYAGRTTSLDALPDGATIAVPNDTTNEARALLLLQENGLITLKQGAGLNATALDIESNPKNLVIQEIAAEQVARALPDVDMGIINGNYALLAGLSVETDALARETDASQAAVSYVNVVAVRAGDENREDIQALVDALKSPETLQWIEQQYKGAVVPVQ